jgi:multicomponent Na+:H+ antiporter subunit F
MSLLLLLTMAGGLVRVIIGPTPADRMMAAQLFGSGGVAVLLLLAAATDNPAAVDIALTLALLAAFASIAFYKGTPGRAADDAGEDV